MKKLEVIHYPDTDTFLVGTSNADEAGGFTLLGDISDKVPFIIECVQEDLVKDMSFENALTALKEGERVARQNWNGKGMWLAMIDYSSAVPRGKNVPTSDEVRVLPWVGLKTADNNFVPWQPSQTDLFSHDWFILQ